eukprot:scaffold110727_cov75-Phaeocystis_antarctica.AAC.2
MGGQSARRTGARREEVAAFRADVTRGVSRVCGARVHTPSSAPNHSSRRCRSLLMKPARESEPIKMAGSWAMRFWLGSGLGLGLGLGSGSGL